MVYPILAKVAARKSAREGHRVIVKVYVTYKLMLMQKLMPGTSPLKIPLHLTRAGGRWG